MELESITSDSLDFEIENFIVNLPLDGSPLEITGSERTSLVINIDLNSWFKDSDGMDLDPKKFNNFKLIDENIENYFEGYEEEFDNDDDSDD